MIRYTDKPPQAMGWPSLEEAGEYIDTNWDASFSAIVFVFERWAGYWICEVRKMGQHVGWIGR